MAKKILTTDKVIQMYPSAQVVYLDDEFAKILEDFSWNNFYFWVAKHVTISDDNYKNLHNITYVSREIHDKMMKALRKKISKKYGKMSKEKLDRSVSFSDLASGPMELIDMQKITGEVFIVIPLD